MMPIKSSCFARIKLIHCLLCSFMGWLLIAMLQKTRCAERSVEMFHYLKTYPNSSITFLSFHVITFEIHCEKSI